MEYAPFTRSGAVLHTRSIIYGGNNGTQLRKRVNHSYFSSSGEGKQTFVLG